MIGCAKKRLKKALAIVILMVPAALCAFLIGATFLPILRG